MCCVCVHPCRVAIEFFFLSQKRLKTAKLRRKKVAQPHPINLLNYCQCECDRTGNHRAGKIWIYKMWLLLLFYYYFFVCVNGLEQRDLEQSPDDNRIASKRKVGPKSCKSQIYIFGANSIGKYRSTLYVRRPLLCRAASVLSSVSSAKLAWIRC